MCCIPVAFGPGPVAFGPGREGEDSDPEGSLREWWLYTKQKWVDKRSHANGGNPKSVVYWPLSNLSSLSDSSNNDITSGAAN